MKLFYNNKKKIFDIFYFLKFQKKNELNFFFLQKEEKTLNNFLFFFKNITQNNSYNYFEKLLSIILRNGKKLHFFNKIIYTFELINFLFIFNMKKMFLKFQTLYDLSRSLYMISNNFFNKNFFLEWLSKDLEPVFYKKAFTFVKRVKKRKKKIKVYKIFYIEKLKRKKIFLQWLYKYSKFINHKNLVLRLFPALLESFVRKKDSKLYLKKIISYKKVFWQLLK